MFFRKWLVVVVTCCWFTPDLHGQIFRGRGGNYYQPPAQQYRPPVQPASPLQQTPVQPGGSIIQNPAASQISGQPQGQSIQQIPAPSGAIPGLRVSNGPKFHWSQAIVDGVDKDHDFGAVAKASNQVHIFEFVNSLDTTLYLTGVRTSCGCTKARILTNEVKPGETAKIEARFDTVAFSGARSATLSVGVSKREPYSEYSEVRFSVKGLIRTDVVFEPGTIDFGAVAKGTPAERSLLVKYAGRHDWRVESAVCSNPNIVVDVKESMRDRSRSRTDYLLTLELSGSAPNGRFNDILTVKTNDLNNAILTVPVTGSIESPITASDINLGMIEKGKSHEKKLIISGKEPFEIQEIISENSRLEFSRDFGGAKTLHIVVFKFNADKEGIVADDIVIRTNSEAQPELRVNFKAQVIANTIVGDKQK